MNLRQRDRSLDLEVTRSGGAVTMFPPLTLDRETADRSLDILERSAS